jgi:hypothetical protein
MTAILGSDVMVADISTANPNVLYEVGLRHALRRHVTVLVMESGMQIPVDVSLARVLTYQLDAAGQLVSEQPMRQILADVIREVETFERGGGPRDPPRSEPGIRTEAA